MAYIFCECGFKKHSISDEHIGKRAKCPKCGVRIPVKKDKTPDSVHRKSIMETGPPAEKTDHQESSAKKPVTAETKKETTIERKHPKMKKFLILVIISVTCASLIGVSWRHESYEDQLIRVQVENRLGYIAESLKSEPVEIQALFLDYSDNKELVLKSHIALMKYREKAGKVLMLYGEESEFKEILLKYGDIIIPIIHYFTEHEMTSLTIMQSVGKTTEAAAEAVKKYWDRATGKEQADAASEEKHMSLGPEERGWYAVNCIKTEGHDFLGQFTADKQGNVSRIHTERILEGISSFFAGGVRTLETKYKSDEQITTTDLLWAGVDAAVFAGSVKLLRAGKTMARSGKQVSLAKRTRAFAAKTLPKGKTLQSIAKYSAAAAAAYIVIRHPSLMNGVFAEVAEMFGLNPLLLQIPGWSLIIFLILYPFIWIIKIVIFPIVWLFNLFLSSLMQIEIMIKKYAPENKRSSYAPALSK